ncbi:S8 family peptidase [Aquisalibacillus elongatus]|uniref:Subtilase family protein n=1 Tax=Aquisalibacillus elongatus TaxID=485577 RepID=A0A3N5B9D6_9BACI|nr:S8 family serine peptidase [Aquisalibacillus elongatus]RPF54346.1 subtilase family protein [Aquisalibacillus elongatus]
MRKWIIAMVAAIAIAAMSFTTLGADAEEDYYSVVLKNNAKVEQFKGDLSLTDAEIVYEVPEIGYYQVKGTEGDLNQIKGFKAVQAASPSLSWDLPEQESVEFNGDLDLSGDLLGDLNGDLYGDLYGDLNGDLLGDLNGDLLDEAGMEMPGFWPIQWDIQRITENGASFAEHTGSHDTVVAVIDTGINPTHQDLAPNLVDGSKNFVPEGGFQGTEPDETGDPDNFVDLHGHGSHVSGSIAGAGNGMLGVAPDLGLRAYRVFGTSSAESAWIYDAMISAADDGSDVLSMSLGGWDLFGQTFVKNEDGKWENAGNDVADYVAYQRAAKYAESKGSVVVVAAGNDGLDLSNNNQVMDYLNSAYGSENVEFRGTGKTVPAQLSNVVNVSSTGPNDVLAVYSNYGAGQVDIATVGGDTRLYDQYAAEGRLDEYLDNQMYILEFNLSADNLSNDGYYFSVGTSMATPKVSAVAGLIIDQNNGELSPAQVKRELLKDGVEEVNGQDKKLFGNGHLNAVNALQ